MWLILLLIGVLLEPYSTSLSPGRISPMLSSKFASICMIHGSHILLRFASIATSAALLTLAWSSTGLHLLSWSSTLTLTGQGAQTPAALPQVMSSSSAAT
jgi:hypothetical protein